MAVYDKDNTGTGGDPDDDLDNLVEAGADIDVDESDDAQAVANQRRKEARAKLEAKIATDEARARRQRNKLLSLCLVAVLVLSAIAGGLWWKHDRDQKAEAEQQARDAAAAREAARWVDCAYPVAPDPAIAMKEGLKKQKDQLATEEKKLTNGDVAPSQMEEYQKGLVTARNAIEELEDNLEKVQKTGSKIPPPKGKEAKHLSTEGEIKTSLVIGGKRVEVTLTRKSAPCNVNAIQYLIQKNYFANTQCDRITRATDTKTKKTKIAVLWCGDATGTGSGSAGFTVPVEETKGLKNAKPSAEDTAPLVIYPKGTVVSMGSNPGAGRILIIGEDLSEQAGLSVIGHVDPKYLNSISALTKREVEVKEGQTPVEGQEDGKPVEPISIRSWKLVS